MAILSACGQQASESTAGDNLVLITIDTLRADHLGVHGYGRETSPRIDHLATEGTTFLAAEANWPKTGPSFASLMTGTYPALNGVRALRVVLADELTTLGEAMQSEGYKTAAFVTNINVGERFGFAQGFDEFHQMWDRSVEPARNNKEVSFLSNEQIVERVNAWLEQNRAEKFFLWVHFLDPHGPYLPPGDLDRRFDGDEIHQEQEIVIPRHKIPRHQRRSELRSVGDYIAAYDGEVLSTDAAVGSVLDQIAGLELEMNTLVVLTSDHGESLGEHEFYFAHGGYAYEATTHVPLVLRHPERIPAGRRIEVPVALIDLMPTLLELLEISPQGLNAQLQGTSLAPLILGDPYEAQPIFIESLGGQRAVRLGSWKLVHDPREGLWADRVGNWQLYNLEEDPGETRNLVDQEPERTEKMRQLMERLTRSAALGVEVEAVPVDDSELSADEIERLKALGYIN